MSRGSTKADHRVMPGLDGVVVIAADVEANHTGDTTGPAAFTLNGIRCTVA